MNPTCPRELEVLQAVECRSQRTLSDELRRPLPPARSAPTSPQSRQPSTEPARISSPPPPCPTPAASGASPNCAPASKLSVPPDVPSRPHNCLVRRCHGPARRLRGATSTGVQSALAWFQRQAPGLDSLAWMAAISGFVADRWLYFAVLAGVVILLPSAVCWALSRE